MVSPSPLCSLIRNKQTATLKNVKSFKNMYVFAVRARALWLGSWGQIYSTGRWWGGWGITKVLNPGISTERRGVGGLSDMGLPLISQRLLSPSGKQDAQSLRNHSLYPQKKEQAIERKKETERGWGPVGQPGASKWTQTRCRTWWTRVWT